MGLTAAIRPLGRFGGGHQLIQNFLNLVDWITSLLAGGAIIHGSRLSQNIEGSVILKQGKLASQKGGTPHPPDLIQMLLLGSSLVCRGCLFQNPAQDDGSEEKRCRCS
jgi:hypothetical protein